MQKYFSKTTMGFYDTKIYRLSTDDSEGSVSLPPMPPDAVVVSDMAYSNIFAALGEGQVLAADVNGNPTAVAPSTSQLQLWTAHQLSAKAALADSDVTMSRVSEAVMLGANSWTASDVVAFVNYRRALRTILSAPSGDPTQPLPTKPAYPSGT